MNIVNELDAGHRAYYCRAILTTDDHGDNVVRVAWKPDEIDLAHLANGGTIWLSTWGGLPPHMLEVQPGESAPS